MNVGAPHPNVEMETKEEDETYVPSEEKESEDEVLESEMDQDIWLQDVEHPTSSHRPKGPILMPWLFSLPICHYLAPIPSSIFCILLLRFGFPFS